MSTALNEVPGWYIEFQAALLRQAPRPGEIDQMTAEGWTNNQKGLKKNLANCLLPQMPVVPVEPTKLELLLDLVGTVTTSAATSKFVAKDRFVIDTSDEAKVKISGFGNNFTKWFLSGDGKTEDPIGEQVLHCYKLRKAAHDVPHEEGERAIIPELGGEAKAETTLSEMFSLMEKQKNGEDGVLLNNGYANIFYIRYQTGVLRTVRVFWNDDGWHVIADSVEYPCRWYYGSQVFSRNSVLESSEPLAPAQA